MGKNDVQTALADWPMETLAAFCRRWQIVELAVFGSAVRGELRPDSDVDLLVTFAHGARRSLTGQMQMQEEIEAILGRPVDLVNRRAIERSRNAIRRKAILESARTIYAEVAQLEKLLPSSNT